MKLEARCRWGLYLNWRLAFLTFCQMQPNSKYALIILKHQCVLKTIAKIDNMYESSASLYWACYTWPVPEVFAGKMAPAQRFSVEYSSAAAILFAKTCRDRPNRWTWRTLHLSHLGFPCICMGPPHYITLYLRTRTRVTFISSPLCFFHNLRLSMRDGSLST